MFLPRRNTTVKNNPAQSDNALAQKFNVFAIRQMEKAKKPSLLGDILISRPGLMLTIDENNKVIVKEIHADDIKQDHDEDNNPLSNICFNPMLYIVGEEKIGNVTYYRMINLNTPLCHKQKLKDIFDNIQKPFKKYPVFSGGHMGTQQTPSFLIPSKHTWLDVSLNADNRIPFVEISGARDIQALLSHSTEMPLLAFNGCLYMPKDEIAQLMAYDKFFAVQNLDAATALSPFAESKYLKAFEHIGLNTEDVCRLSRQKTPNVHTNYIKH